MRIDSNLTAVFPTLTILLITGTVFGGDLEKMILIEDPATLADKFTPYADFRLRYEADWNSVKTDGTPRDDRHRLRVRGRVGLKFEPTDELTFDVRARTGDTDGQQSPHLTIHDFNGGDRDDFDGFLDKLLRSIHDRRLDGLGRAQRFPFLEAE